MRRADTPREALPYEHPPMLPWKRWICVACRWTVTGLKSLTGDAPICPVCAHHKRPTSRLLALDVNHAASRPRIEWSL